MGGAAAPFILGPVAAEGSFGPAEKSMFGSAMFVGMWAGSCIGGTVSDGIGPGRTMIGAVLALFVCGVLPVILPVSALTAVFGRFAVGFCLVNTYQAGNNYLAESIPTKVRSAYLTALHIAIAVGGLLTVGLATMIPRDAWRRLLVLNALPALAVFAVAATFVIRNESPRWLLVIGRAEAAVALLRRIAARQGSKLAGPIRLRLQTSNADDGSGAEADESASSKMSEASTARLRQDETHYYSTWRQKLLQLRHHDLWRMHAGGCLVAFCLNFGTKGSEIWLGTYIDELGIGNMTRASTNELTGLEEWLHIHFSRLIYFGAIFGKILGDLINLSVSQRLGRLHCLQISFWGASACVLLLSQLSSPWLLLLLATLQGGFVDMLWCNVYVYLAESFPTSIRSTAFGLTMGVGRSGGVASAALGGALSSVQLAFVIYGMAFVLGGISVCFLGVETSGRPLRDAVV